MMSGGSVHCALGIERTRIDHVRKIFKDKANVTIIDFSLEKTTERRDQFYFMLGGTWGF